MTSTQHVAYHWVPIVGEFVASDRDVTFHGRVVEIPSSVREAAAQEGREVPMEVPSLGNILSDQQMTNGVLSAKVIFSEVGPTTGCELVLGFDVESRGFVSAGITGDQNALFAIREWHSGTRSTETSAEQARWIPYAFGGDRSFLQPGQEYALRVSLQGSRMTLEIDGVRVAAANIRTPFNSPRPTGIWCLSHSSVRICDFAVDTERPRAFIVMHFAKPYDEVYSQVIHSVCDRFGLAAIRADEIYGPGIIINDIVEQIHRAQVIIAEITPENANVYFEIGYAYAWNKPILLLARQGTELPFDVSAFRVLFYEDSIAGKARVEEGLTRHLQAIIGER